MIPMPVLIAIMKSAGAVTDAAVSAASAGASAIAGIAGVAGKKLALWFLPG